MVPLSISIHAPREGSDKIAVAAPTEHTISIHAPREGSDGRFGAGEAAGVQISIHAPREGSDGKRLTQTTK